MNRLQDLEAQLDANLEYDNLGVPTNLENLLVPIAEPGHLRTLLEEVLHSADHLREIASSSYTHENGFDKIVLARSSRSKCKLRLHIWWPDRREHHEHIHDHRWNFGSVVLAGFVDASFYELTPDGEIGMRSYEYLPDAKKSQFSLRDRGDVRLRNILTCRLPAGTVYSLSSAAFHRLSISREKTTVTLVLQGPPQRASCSLITDEATVADTVPTVLLEPAALAQRIRSLLRLGVL